MKPGNWIFAGALAVLGIALSLPASAQNDSAIVQAAKQKASQKKTGHVYTDDDFPQSSAPDTSATSQGTDTTGSAGTTTSDAATDKADAKPGDKKSDGKPGDAKAADNQKLKDLEAKLADAKKGEQELQRKLDTLQQKADATQDPFRKSMYQDMISNQQVTLDEFRKSQESLAAQIDQEKSKSKDAAPDQDKKTEGQ